MIKQAVIAAGGFGTRLRPFTDTAPKPMIPVLGKPMLAWDIEQFKKYGVTEVFCTLHYLPEVVMDYFGDGSRFGVKMHYTIEQESLGSAGGIKEFEQKLDDEFFYIYGDMVSLMDYVKMERAWREKPTGTIGMQRVQRTDDHADADTVELDETGRLIAVHPKPHAQIYPNAYRARGMFILNKKILSYIPGGESFDFGRQLLPAVLAGGEKFYGYECDDYSKGIDTVEKLREVEARLSTQQHS